MDYFYLKDDMGNVVALTDKDGTVLERYEYGDFGEPTIYSPGGTVLAASAYDNTLLYGARPWEPDLKLYNFRYRWYDPAMGRFINRDPIGIWGDGLNNGNGMSYTPHSPWSYTDPLGLYSPTCRFITDSDYRDKSLRAAGWLGGPEPSAAQTAGNSSAVNAQFTGQIGAGQSSIVAYGDMVTKTAGEGTAAVARMLNEPLDFALTAGETIDDLAKGDYGAAWLSAVGLLPLVPGGVAKEARGAFRGAEHLEQGARNASKALRGVYRLPDDAQKWRKIVELNRELCEDFKKSGGQIKFMRGQQCPAGKGVFGRISPSKKVIEIYEGANIGTISEELLHFRQLKNGGYWDEPWKFTESARARFEDEMVDLLTGLGFEKMNP